MAGILKVDRVQSDSNLSFQVAGANVAYFNATGLNVTGGEIIAGGSTLRTTSGLIYANNGISFPAAMVASSDANTLDDYEEGSWTPSWTFASGGPSSGGTAVGRYIKIGKQVTCWFYINPTSIASGSGQLYLSGLPFSNTSDGGASEGASLIPNYWGSWASSVIPGGYVQGNQSRVYMVNIAPATGISALTSSNMNNTSSMYGNVTYYTA